MSRRFQRIPLEFPGRLELDGRACPVRVLDISLRGVLVECEGLEPLAPGTPGQVDIPLSDEAGIAFEGTVRWQQGERLGLEIAAMPLESAGHLRRLVELNLGDEALLEREFAAMVAEPPGEDDPGN
ncbi:PilZ domain-containing protein [Thioalkalivibrio sp. ALJ24]|uniref:PilZ domain-containing protein n=1 Tax=Thioalkalivibrio sp. ALJ24 TaxID=545276 RepID=UPI0004774AAD|nr:PilZ domain-containing protein [Thioalkalivibrio sp. ALJ24]